MIYPKHIFTLLLFSLFSLSLLSQDFNMDGTAISSCAGYFHDSGGVANGYANNENFTTTICSDGTEGTHIQLFFSGIDIGTGDSIMIYDAPIVDDVFLFDNGFLLQPDNPFIVQATAANASGCLTIVFTSNNVDDGNSGWNANISCIPSCQTIEAILVSSTPVASPVDTGWIDICPGDEVFFEGSGNYLQNLVSYIQSNSMCTFEWDFGDGTRGIGINASHIYDEPGGYIVQLTITDQMGCTNTNFLNQRVRVSTYPTFILESNRDSIICAADTINITSSVDTLIASDLLVRANGGFFYPPGPRTDTIKLPDGIGSAYESSVFYTQFPAGAILENAEDLLGVLLNIEHSYYGDLSIELICPDGTSIALLDRSTTAPLGTANLGEPWATAPSDIESDDCTKGCGYDYTFVNNSPNGTLRDVVVSLPNEPLTTKPSEEDGDIFNYIDKTFPAGEYQSDDPFSEILGCPLNGQWTIRITDYLAKDNGWLFSWGLIFRNDLFTNAESFTPVFTDWNWESNPSIVSSSPTSLLAIPANPGEAQYTFWVMDDFGCRYDTTLVYEVLPQTHPQCFSCNIEINEQADLLVCQGEVVQLDLSPVSSLESCIEFEQFPQYDIGAANHPANTPYSSVFNVNSIDPGVITNPITDICSICVDLSTDILSHITLILEAPDGSQVLLSEMNGGNSSAGYVQTCFTPTSLTEISTGTAPFTGAFQPQDINGWSNLVNSPINGRWVLWVTDCCDLTQMGELLEWSISFNNVKEYTYNWTASPDLSCLDCDNPILTAGNSGDQTLIITDNFGCVLMDTVSVQIIEDLPIPAVNCTAQNNGILFEWTAPADILEFEYQLTINGIAQGWQPPTFLHMLFIDSFSHNDIVSIEVRVYLAEPSVNCDPSSGESECVAVVCDLVLGAFTTEDASCFNINDGTININVAAGTMPFSYQVDNVDYNSPNISGLTAGDHTYTVVNGIGCDITRDFTISSPDSLYIDVTQIFAACFGVSENEATAIAGGGSGTGYNYTWSNGQSGADQDMLSANDYQVAVIDSDGCEASTAITISNLDSISFNFLTDPPSCFGLSDGGVGINQITGGIGMDDADYSYVWENGSTNVVRTNIPGGFTYCVTVTDVQGCIAERCRFLSQPDIIPVELQETDPSCKGDQDGQISITTPTLLDDYSIEWSSNTGGQINETALGLAAGTYSVTITNTEGCMGSNSTTLNDPLTLSNSFDLVHNDCFNYTQGSIQSVPAGGVGPYQYQWSSSLVDTSLIENLSAGDYSVTVTDNNGCTIEDLLTITQPNAVMLDILTTETTCFDDHDGTIDITVNGGSPPFQYSLNGGEFFNSSFILGLEAGVYNIQVEDDNECRFFSTAEVIQPLEFMIDINPVFHINFGDSIWLSSTPNNARGNVLYFWQEPYFGTLNCLACEHPFASPEYTTDYQLLAIDTHGCEAEGQFRIFVHKDFVVEVPTGFTPNGDNVNDLLRVHGTPGVQVLSFQVFDRWGEEVYYKTGFEVNSPMGWNGDLRDQSFNSGVFVWQLRVLYPDGKEEVLAGQTTLIR